MKPILPIVVAGALVAGCAANTETGEEFDHQAFAQFAIAQVKTYNQLGIDPIQLEPTDDKLLVLVAACGTVVGAIDTGLIDIGVAGDDVLAYCGLVIEAAQKAESDNESPDNS